MEDIHIKIKRVRAGAVKINFRRKRYSDGFSSSYDDKRSVR